MKQVFKGIIIFLVSFLCITTVSAASFSLSAGSRNLTKGGSTKLTISVSDVTGRFNISSSNSSVISISDTYAWLENNSYTLTLNALSVGSSTITVTPANVSDGSGNPANLSAKSITISVALPREKSTNNDLASLSVEGYELTPAFNKKTLEYSVAVPSEINEVTINAKAADSYASVKGAGKVEVSEGSNRFEIVVTSETGKAKTYVVTVNVEDNNPIEVDVDGKTYTLVKNSKSLTMPENFTETSVKINDYPIPAFYNEQSKITLVGLKDEAGNIGLFIYEDGKYTPYKALKVGNLTLMILDINSSFDYYKKSSITINDVDYECLKYNNSKTYALFYAKNLNTGEENYYMYDSKEQTVQRYDDTLIKDLENKIKKQEKKEKTLYIIMASISLFAILVLVFFGIKTNKLKNIVSKD